METWLAVPLFVVGVLAIWVGWHAGLALFVGLGVGLREACGPS